MYANGWKRMWERKEKLRKRKRDSDQYYEEKGGSEVTGKGCFWKGWHDASFRYDCAAAKEEKELIEITLEDIESRMRGR